MDKQLKEQKIFNRYYRSVEVCGKCGGEGIITVYTEGDIYKDGPSLERVCPLCEGYGMLRKTVTITTDLAPFRRE